MGAVVLAAATVAATMRLEPFATWYYPFAWYATLLILDAAVALRGGRFLFLSRPAFTASVLAWSAPFWLLFELFNFRLRDWYYVFLPADPVARWAGILLSYATVLPAILGSERLLEAGGLARGTRTPPFRASRPLLAGLQVAGAAMLGLCLVWPRALFPLVWGGVTLLADPWVYRRDPSRSLVGDLERGRPGRILRLAVGGLAVGLLWEAYNGVARGRWIYTVPGFEAGKLFEMPLAGFLGFPAFALEAFAGWQALVVAGAAVPAEGRSAPAPRAARAAALLAAAVFSVLVLAGMGRSTIASTTPRLADLPGLPAARLERAGWDPFSLARADPDSVARALAADPARVRRWVETARLATLRGIGAGGARALGKAGIGSVAALARADPDELAARLTAAGEPVPRARVGVWVRAARASAPSTPDGRGEASWRSWPG